MLFVTASFKEPVEMRIEDKNNITAGNEMILIQTLNAQHIARVQETGFWQPVMDFQ